jgi:hypothetical protein
MRNMLLYLSALVYAVQVYAQATPTFQFTMYFTDSKGNKDSLVLGYAPDATSWDNLDPQYGEIDISDTPFDTVLDVRITLSNSTAQLKKQIYQITCDNLNGIVGAGSVLNIYAKYPPIDITWNKDLFYTYNYPCHSYANIVADSAPEVDCATCPSIFYLQFADHRFVTFEEGYAYQTTPLSLEGGGYGMGYLYYFYFFNKPWTEIVSTHNVYSNSLYIYPNIAHSAVRIEGEFGYNALPKVVDIMGAEYPCAVTYTSTGLLLDISLLPKGMFIIQMPTKEGNKMTSGRFVKL